MFSQSRIHGSFVWRFVAAFAMILSAMAGLVPITQAQSGTSDIAIVTSYNGSNFYNACYVLVNYSQEGCDVNGDGDINFDDIPYGTYTLRQTRDLGSGLYVADTTIYVTGASEWDGRERFYVSVQGGSSSSSGTSNIAIVTSYNGSNYYDACFVLVDYSQEGCDVNGDGDITFDDIPYGTYTLRQTRNLGSGLYVSDTSIKVTGASDWDGRERFYVSVESSPVSDIAVVTTQNGEPYYDACFVLVDYSMEGCDENRDGDVTFDDIPYGTYTLRQTRDLGSDLFVADTTIQVTGAADSDGRERFPAIVESSVPPVDISLITRDPEDGALLRDACYILVDFSEEGCDDNLDGQVTFDAIPPGTYTVRQTKTPEGYPTINEYEINVANIDDLPIGFVVRQAPDQNEPGTRNVSVIFYDEESKAKIVTDICVEFVGASEVGCDDDLRDGQIDFVDLPAGEWNLDFTGVPDGWAISPVGGQDAPVLIMDTDESPANHFVLVPVSVGSSSKTSSTTNTTAVATATEAATTSAASDSTEMVSMGLSAKGPDGYIDGARFTVRSQSGEILGTCTLEANSDPIVQACRVEVPKGITVVVTVDLTSVPAGWVPKMNPIYFDTGSPVQASFWGVSFEFTAP